VQHPGASAGRQLCVVDGWLEDRGQLHLPARGLSNRGTLPAMPDIWHLDLHCTNMRYDFICNTVKGCEDLFPNFYCIKIYHLVRNGYHATEAKFQTQNLCYVIYTFCL